jgi:uncharacterized protein
MIKPDLLAILCCPETQQPLAEASAEIVAAINQKISSGQVKNRAAEVVREAIESGLVREDRKFLYPIRNQIPVLLIDQAIPVD